MHININHKALLAMNYRSSSRIFVRNRDWGNGDFENFILVQATHTNMPWKKIFKDNHLLAWAVMSWINYQICVIDSNFLWQEQASLTYNGFEIGPLIRLDSKTVSVLILLMVGSLWIALQESFLCTHFYFHHTNVTLSKTFPSIIFKVSIFNHFSSRKKGILSGRYKF